MNPISDLHRQAMDLAEKAFSAKLNGDSKQAHEMLKKAFVNERNAAELVSGDIDAEPTRSVLHRSAASLAIDCGEFREAERLIARALGGNPPNEIAEELRDLFEQVNFQRHLEVRGVLLDPSEFQLSIAGNAVGFGMAHSDEFVKRVEVSERLIHRTAERKMGKPFRERGKAGRSIKEGLELYVSIPRAASFAVSIRLGRHKEQLSLGPEFSDSYEILDELLSCFELFNNAEEDILKQRIQNDAYYRNFVALAREMAPDGEEVKLVGFTAIKNTLKREVPLTRYQRNISLVEKIQPSHALETRVSVKGQLLYADSTSRQEGRIKLVDEEGKKHDIVVPEGMMGDIVKPLWEDNVIVTGIRNGKAIHLADIQKVSEQ